MKHTEKVHAVLKHKVEDFIVEEIQGDWRCLVSEDFIQPTIHLEESEGKEFVWCELEKKNIDHFTALQEVAKQLRLDKGMIGYAGTKDKCAWTVQRISICKPNMEALQVFSHEHILLKNFKWNKRKIKIGYLDANHFTITLRDIGKKDAIRAANTIRKVKWFPNYFGSQRFGIDARNVHIGTLILQKRFREAADALLEEKQKPLQNYANVDPVKILKGFERKRILLLVHAVQSKIFNEVLERALEEGLDFNKRGMQSCLLPGYKSRFYNGRLGEIEKAVLEEHGLTLASFNVVEIPYLRMKGSFRKAIVDVSNLEVGIADDEEFAGSKKLVLSFTLPSGVYATTFLENFFEFGQV